MPPRIQTFNVAPRIPEALAPLLELAYDLTWTWCPEAERLFRRVDAELWDAVNSNPVALLGRVHQDQLERLAGDESFLRHMARVEAEVAHEHDRETWFSRRDATPDQPLIAYFCAEYGLTEALPIYSGGLGVLAGDHLKAASNLGLPLVAVGLAYQEGYFHQYLNVDGWQQEAPYDNDFQMLPMRRARFPDGTPASVDVPIEGRVVHVRIWEVKVGRTRLFLMDTNSPRNLPEDRNITYRLYGGDRDYRCKQEIVLGIGGFYALQAMGIFPTVFHMNEGHSAFMGLARMADLRRRAAARGITLSFAEAREACAASNVFTTHTPVPAGFDVFSREQIDRFLPRIHDELGIDRKTLYGLGAHEGDPAADRGINMAYLALRCSGWVNGVSQLHATVSRGMWQRLWPGAGADEVPIFGVTNGIHTPTWVGEEMRELLDRYLGEKWRTDAGAPGAYTNIERVPDAELWRTHERAREQLVSFVRQRSVNTAERLRLPPTDITALGEVLDPRALTIGFARRFATYKRATLLLKHPERLRALLLDEQRPVQLIFAGKAHPMDVPAKGLIQELVHFARDPAIRRRIIFVEEYDMGVARRLVQGVDVWLNNPRRPKEASGTSGMKVVMNGGLNLSVLDGWWAEAYDGDNGWAIGHGESYADETDKGDEIEARELLEVLEHQVVPEFYSRGPDHLPHRWIARMKRSMATLGAFFSTDRMVREYAERMYFHASDEGAVMAREDFEPARILARQVARLERGWHDVRIGQVKIDAAYDLVLGQPIGLEVDVHLGQVEPVDVVVEAVGGLIDGQRRVQEGEVTTLTRDEASDAPRGWHRYRGVWTPKMSGHNGCLVRLRPAFERGAPARELAVRFWE